MNLIVYKKEKDNSKKYLENYLNYLVGFEKIVSDINLKPFSSENLNDEEKNCLKDICCANFFEEVTEGEFLSVFRNIASAFCKQLNITQVPTIKMEIYNNLKKFGTVNKYGALTDKNEICLFVPSKEIRKQIGESVTFLHLDMLNVIIHELLHIVANAKQYKALKSCLDDHDFLINESKFADLPSVDQMLVWQGLASDIISSNGKNSNDLYEFSFEELYVRINTLKYIQQLKQEVLIPQNVRDEISCYLNYMIFDECYYGCDAIFDFYCETNETMFKYLNKVDKNLNNALIEDLKNLKIYLEKTADKAIKNYLSIRIKDLEKEKMFLYNYYKQNNKNLIKEDNKYILNYLYYYYINEGQNKKAQDILSFNLKTSDLSTVLQNLLFAKKERKKLKNIDKEK